MNDQAPPVPMHLVHPGTATLDGEFIFEMEARSNSARTVRFVLSPQDAEMLNRRLEEYLTLVSK